jgi:hypothetical protein
VVWPTGPDSPNGALFNLDWMTFIVMAVIALIGAVYYIASRPQERVAEHIVQPEEAAGSKPKG